MSPANTDAANERHAMRWLLSVLLFAVVLVIGGALACVGIYHLFNCVHP